MSDVAALIERATALQEQCRIGVEERGVMPDYVSACVRFKAMAPQLLAALIAASVDTLPKGQDAQQGLAGTEGSAVANGETPTPSSAQPGDA